MTKARCLTHHPNNILVLNASSRHALERVSADTLMRSSRLVCQLMSAKSESSSRGAEGRLKSVNELALRREVLEPACYYAVAV